MTVFALTSRPSEDILFATSTGGIRAAPFAGAAIQLAQLLHDRPYAVNLCRDRYAFALAFAACILRGHVSLLCADSSPGHLRHLADRFAGAYSISEDPGCASPLPHIQLPHLAHAPGADAPSIEADRLVAMVFTSGSTGEPTAHAKSWGQLATRTQAASAAFGLAGAWVVGTVPPQHMYGFETTVLLPLHARTTTWCGPAFFPADIATSLAAGPAPRVLVTTPVHLQALLAARVTLPPLHRIVCATAPLDLSLALAAEARWQTEVHEIFGATEVGSIAARRTVSDPAWRTYPGVRVDQSCVTAPWADPMELHDRVEPTPDGFRLLGRRTDLVKIGGRRASLSGLNAALLRLPGVVDGVMLPPRPGESRMLAFAVAPGCTPEELLAALRAEIDPVFLPRPLLCVERLPRNEVGKLPRAALDTLRQAVAA